MGLTEEGCPGMRLELLEQPFRWARGWPLHDIAIANIVWCMTFKGGVGGGGVYCAMVVQ